MTSREVERSGTDRRFDVVVASVKDCAIFMLDTEGRVATWNEGAQLIKGYLPEEIIGKDVSIFYEPGDQARGKPHALLDRAIGEGRVEDEGWRVRKDGSRFWADVVITPIRDAGGQLRGFVKITRDLTVQREAEEKLRQSESSLRATLYSIGDAVLVVDDHAKVTRMNPVAERLTGWTEREAIDRPIMEVFKIINEESRAAAPNPVDRVLTEGVVVGLANHTALISRQGIESPIADSGAPIVGPEGKPQGAVLVFRDITAERKSEEALRQNEQRLELIVNSLQDYALITLDREGRVTSWNAGAERIEGYRQAEIVGQHFSRFFTSEDAAAGRPAHELGIAASQGRFEGEGWRVRKDGSRFWADVIVTPISDASGQLVGFLKITRDLTERRQAFEERLRATQASEAIRLRDEFLSIASHELKTPLAALLLQLASLRGQLPAGAEAVLQKMDRAKRMGERLAQLIDTLLDVSRIATGRFRLTVENFDLREAIGDVEERLRESAAREGCDLVVDASMALKGRWDRLRVEQVLTNLLGNAIKYAPRRPIHVSATREGEAALLRVTDEGPGIPEADLGRIFERFERVASKKTSGGMGLGLYVARQLVEAHGGTIAASNLATGGACFTVRLPIASPGPAA